MVICVFVSKFASYKFLNLRVVSKPPEDEAEGWVLEEGLLRLLAVLVHGVSDDGKVQGSAISHDDVFVMLVGVHQRHDMSCQLLRVAFESVLAEEMDAKGLNHILVMLLNLLETLEVWLKFNFVELIHESETRALEEEVESFVVGCGVTLFWG